MNRRSKVWLAIFIAAALVRVLTLPAYPLHDTTEARYSEVARLMMVSGDWIAPRIEAGVPFWGKPPLSFWLTATSFKLFGLNEFAARLPSFLLTLLTALLVFRLGDKLFSIEAALAASTILLTSCVGFIAAGAVMTDASLLFATTISMIAFWMTAVEQDRRWRYIFFAGLGLGLLAKGPIALVLVGFPVIVWLLYYRRISESLRCMPWITGTFVMLAVAAPWYVLAELKTPGFLEYFLIGEHWLRFVDSGWQGDLYGDAHSRPRGAIWLFWIVAALPWSILAIYAALMTRRNPEYSLTPFQSYALLWCLTPLLFFTFAGNILPAYVLPGIPALALLLGGWMTTRKSNAMHCGWLMPVVIVVAIAANSFGMLRVKTQKNLVNYQISVSPTAALVYYPEKPSSADFYSRGNAQAATTGDDLLAFLATPGKAFVAIARNETDDIPAEVRTCVRVEAEFARYVLYEKLPSGCSASANSKSD